MNIDGVRGIHAVRTKQIGRTICMEADILITRALTVEDEQRIPVAAQVRNALLGQA